MSDVHPKKIKNKKLPNSTKRYSIKKPSRFELIVSLCLILLSLSFCLQKTFKNNLLFTQNTLETKVRDAAGRAPSLDPHLIIFSYNDATAEVNDNAPSLNIVQLANILQLLSHSKAKAILIDKLFQKDTPTPEEEQTLKKIMTNVTTPVFIGAIGTDTEIPLRKTLDKRFYRLAPNHQETRNSISFAYGPNPIVGDIVAGVGHIVAPLNNQFRPFLSTSDGIIPMLALSFSKTLNITTNFIDTEYGRVPLTSDGLLIADVQKEDKYHVDDLGYVLCLATIGMTNEAGVSSAPEGCEKKFSAASIAKLSTDLKNKPRILAKPAIKDNVIIILGNYITGNTDDHASVYKTTFGGFYQASLASSVLANQWLTPLFDSDLAGIIISILLVVIAVLLARRNIFTALITAGLLACFIVLSGFIAFVYFSVVLPWLLTFILFTSSFVVMLFGRISKDYAIKNHLRKIIELSVPATMVPNILEMQVGDEIAFEPKNFRGTILFWDMVGFSVFSKTESLEKVANTASISQRVVGDIIKQNNGVLSKTLGDGIMAFWGYDFLAECSSDNHEIDAANAAIEIAFKLFRLMQESRIKSSNTTYLPFRIGLHSGEIRLVIDEESAVMPKFTILGDPVNHTKRMEGAAAEGCVMFSDELWQQLFAKNWQPKTDCSIFERLLRIKHNDEFIFGREAHPLLCNGVVRTEFKPLMDLAFANRHRAHDRIDISELKLTLIIEGKYTGQLLEISETGLAFASNMFFGVKCYLTLQIVSDDAKITELLRSTGRDLIKCEIRHGHQRKSDLFMHGSLVERIYGERLLKTLQELIGVAAVNHTHL